MTRKQYRNATGVFSTQLALASFFLGTLILVLHLLSDDGSMLLLGLTYVVIAFVCNFIMLVKLIYLLFTQHRHTQYYTVKILLLLANIPVVFIYLKIVVEA